MVSKLKEYERIAFVASGGAAKAMFFHIGVTLALKEYGVEVANVPRSERRDDRVYIEHIVGSSGGAVYGAMIVNNFDEETIESKLEKKDPLTYFYNPARRMHGDLTGFSYQDIFAIQSPPPRVWRKQIHRLLELPALQRKYGPGFGLEALTRELFQMMGFFSLHRLEKYLKDVLPVNDFEELYIRKQMDFNVIATEIDYPRKAIFGKDRSAWIGTAEDSYYRDRYLNTAAISRAVHASSCVPGLFKPVSIDGIKYYDGEVKENLSIHVAEEKGADLIFVSHIYTPYVRDENMGSITELGLHSLLLQAFTTAMYQKLRASQDALKEKDRMFERVRSTAFRKKYNLTTAAHRELIEDLAEKLNYNPRRKYIFIPTPSEIFFMDHFNLLPYATRELINAGYSMTNEILPIHGFEKLDEYKQEGILETKGFERFKFTRSRYEQYRRVVHETLPKLQ